MKYSYGWLKELSGTNKTPKELAEMVALKGFELEGVEKLSGRFDGIVVGQILEIKKHPNADRLQLVKVKIGKSKAVEVVCGAHNIKAGDKVPVALPGSALPTGKMKITRTKIRGVVSNGMLCAEDELGLGKDHGGIMILDKNAKIGESLSKALALDDYVLEFDVLPNRAHDCLSHEGMGREISAMEGRNFKISNIKYQISNKLQRSKSKTLEIDIRDKRLCPRYIGAVLENVKVGPSPRWMQNRLVACGMEPINNVVDITNYVMLETGSPLHAFDLEKIKIQNLNVKTTTKNSKLKIVVRRAEKNEKLELLDGTKMELDKSDLVIANREKVLALAGIKGGKESGISERTSRIVLEAANFNAFNIRKSRQRHALSTESQARFEKGLSSGLAGRAAGQAIELLQKYAGAKPVEINDANHVPTKTQELDLDLNRVAMLLGVEIEKNIAVKILKNLGFSLKRSSGSKLRVSVPIWRMDIEGPEDLIEEIGRIVGYQQIEEQPIIEPICVPARNEARELEWKFKELFVALGMNEVNNYSFYGRKDVEICGIEADHFELQNPLASQQNLLRRTLLVGILGNIALNAKYFDEVLLFEMAKAYFKEKNNQPNEKLMIAMGMLLKGQKDVDLFVELKGRIEAFFSRVLSLEIYFAAQSVSTDEIFHPARSALVMLERSSGGKAGKKQILGKIGQANPAVAKKYGIEEKVMLAELDFSAICEHALMQKTYRPLRKYPTVLRDISMFAPSKTQTQTIKNIIHSAAGESLVKADLFDVYEDGSNGKKSLAYHLIFGSDSRTLERKEIDSLISKITQALENKGVKVRRGQDIKE